MIQQIVVLETKNAKAATQDILMTHCIPSAISDDLKTKFLVELVVNSSP
jgi:hypothetical protein